MRECCRNWFLPVTGRNTSSKYPTSVDYLRILREELGYGPATPRSLFPSEPPKTLLGWSYCLQGRARRVSLCTLDIFQILGKGIECKFLTGAGFWAALKPLPQA